MQANALTSFGADRPRWGIEPLCFVLTERGIKMGLSNYYERETRKPSKQELRDEAVAKLS